MDLLIDNFPKLLSDHKLPPGTSISCSSGSILILAEDAGPLQPLRFLIEGAQKSLTVSEIISVKLPKGVKLIPVLDLDVSFFPEFKYADRDFFQDIFRNANSLFGNIEIPKHKEDVKRLLRKAGSGKILSKSPHCEDGVNILNDDSSKSQEILQFGDLLPEVTEVEEVIKPVDEVCSFEVDVARGLFLMCNTLAENSETLMNYYSNCLDDVSFLEWYSKIPKGILSVNPCLTDWYQLPVKVRKTLKGLVLTHFRELLRADDSALCPLKDSRLNIPNVIECEKLSGYRGVSEFKSANFKDKSDSPLARALKFTDDEKAKLYDQIIRGLICISDKSFENGDFNPYAGFDMTDNYGFLSLSKEGDNLILGKGLRVEPTVLVRDNLRIPLTEII
jgi:hypothetical protein